MTDLQRCQKLPRRRKMKFLFSLFKFYFIFGIMLCSKIVFTIMSFQNRLLQERMEHFAKFDGVNIKSQVAHIGLVSPM